MSVTNAIGTGLDDPIEATGDLPTPIFCEGVFKMCSAMVIHASRDSERGNKSAARFLADWQSHFGARGRVPHQEISEN